MTATQDKWLNDLPDSSESSGTYWVYNYFTEAIEPATVEWIEGAYTYKICMPFLGVVTTHRSFSTLIRDNYWMRIEKPDMASPDWIDEIPNKTAYYWACNIETQEVFVVAVSWLPMMESLRVYLPERGLVSDGSTFLRDHRWLEIEKPPRRAKRDH